MNIGILGGGQLATMLALAGYPLGIELIGIDPSKRCSAQQVARVMRANFNDLETIKQHFGEVCCVTYETENLPFDAVKLMADHYSLAPDIHALQTTQDRWHEKNFLNELKIPTVEYRAVNGWDDILAAIDELHFPLVLKTRLSGYDGKGQWVMTSEQEARRAWELMKPHPLIVEAFVSYQCELSLLFARGKASEIVFYPLTLNQHDQGILRVSEAPYQNAKLQRLAETYALLIAERLNYTGVMAIEFFCVHDQLLVNEIAPRVHNSGHWTIEGAVTSQFENHLRAITGLPLGSTEVTGFSTMINCIGTEPPLEPLLKIPGLHYHTYGKTPRANRKLGHITLCANDPELLAERVLSCHQWLSV